MPNVLQGKPIRPVVSPVVLLCKEVMLKHCAKKASRFFFLFECNIGEENNYNPALESARDTYS